MAGLIYQHNLKTYFILIIFVIYMDHAFLYQCLTAEKLKRVSFFGGGGDALYIAFFMLQDMSMCDIKRVYYVIIMNKSEVLRNPFTRSNLLLMELIFYFDLLTCSLLYEVTLLHSNSIQWKINLKRMDKIVQKFLGCSI